MILVVAACDQISNLIILTQNLRLISVLILARRNLSCTWIKIDPSRTIHIDGHHVLLGLVWSFKSDSLHVTSTERYSATKLVGARILVVEHLRLKNCLVLMSGCMRLRVRQFAIGVNLFRTQKSFLGPNYRIALLNVQKLFPYYLFLRFGAEVIVVTLLHSW